MAEPIRVLRVIARLNMGGPAIHVTQLAAGLQDRGYETTLVAGTLAEGEESMAFLAERAGVPVVDVPELGREISPLDDLRAVVRLSALIEEVEPHVLHTHTAKAGAVARAAARTADNRPPVIVHTFHGHVLRGYFGPARTTFYRRVEKLLARSSDALVAVSPEVRDELVALGVAPRERFIVIRLGIPLDERTAVASPLARSELGIPEDAFVVGWVGRMTAVKDPQALLEVTHALERLGAEAVLCLVGDGPDRDALERRAAELGLSESVVFAGYQEEVGSWYELFDALLLTSVNEGTPVSVIEALAAGTPVVATRVGGVPDVVRDGVDGFLFEPGDAQGAAERLAELAASPSLRARLGSSGSARVRERYSVERLVGDVDRLYRSLLEQAGA